MLKGQSKLTEDQFIRLDNLIQQQNLKTAKEFQHKIETEFEVKYSIRSVERIMNKLDYSYTKHVKYMLKCPKMQKNN